MSNEVILKDLGAVLSYAKLRYKNEYIKQDILLNNLFKNTFKDYLEKRHCSIEFLEHSSVITTKANQNIFLSNQWFAIGSYFVDFCTELLTYHESFITVCKRLNKDYENFAKRIKISHTKEDEELFIHAASHFFLISFGNDEKANRAAQLLWRFVCDYAWWAGSKTIDRNDFYVSPVLNSLNIVNVSHGFVADIVLAYATDLRLRRLVDSLQKFTINARVNEYSPNTEEKESYQIAENQIITNSLHETNASYEASSNTPPSISISLASIARFKNNGA